MVRQGFIDAVKTGLEDIPGISAHSSSAAPMAGDIYVVAGHEKALNPDTLLVVGGRGSGKSFWSAALSDPGARKLIGHQLPRLRLENYQIFVGFAGLRGDTRYPSHQILGQLLSEGYEAETIWRAVILHQLMKLELVEEAMPGESWGERVSFVQKNPEKEENWLTAINTSLQEQNRGCLIVFDALDRLGSTWSNIRALTQGLLRVCLDMQGFSALHLKLFMRPDMWDDNSLWAFPDASKLQHNQVILEWRKADLYGLLWHWLANRPGGVSCRVREKIEQKTGCSFEKFAYESAEEVYFLPALLKSDESIQEDILELIASPYMGTNRRRGRTYTWLPNHLSDAKGQVSPRSFLLAIKEAQHESEQRGAERVLHYEGIKAGVIKASEIRLQELKEDYPWIDQVLSSLNGLTVPVEPKELVKRWKGADVMSKLLSKPSDASVDVPPNAAIDITQPLTQQHQSLLHTLEEIGVLRYLPDGRINIPDLYRVAAGIKRRGGVKAVR